MSLQIPMEPYVVQVRGKGAVALLNLQLGGRKRKLAYLGQPENSALHIVALDGLQHRFAAADMEHLADSVLASAQALSPAVEAALAMKPSAEEALRHDAGSAELKALHPLAIMGPVTLGQFEGYVRRNLRAVFHIGLEARIAQALLFLGADIVVLRSPPPGEQV